MIQMTEKRHLHSSALQKMPDLYITALPMRKLLFLALVLITLAPLLSWGVKKKKLAVHSNISSVTMRRTACFGRCPEYKIEITRNGQVTYTGIRNVKDTGVYTRNIGYIKAMQIISKLNNNKVDTCRNLYDNRIPDLPGIIYQVAYKDSTKRISNAEWGPAYLKEIAEQIDAIGKPTDKTWKKVKNK